MFSVRDPHEHTKFRSACQIHRSQRELPLGERALVLLPLVWSRFSTRHFQSNGQVLLVNSRWKTRQRDDALPMMMFTYNNPPPVSPYKAAVCCVYAHCDAQPSFSVQALAGSTHRAQNLEGQASGSQQALHAGEALQVGVQVPPHRSATSGHSSLWGNPEGRCLDLGGDLGPMKASGT